MRVSSFIALSCLLGVPHVVSAQWAPPSPCDDSPTPEFGVCFEREQKKADTALNAAYKRAMDFIDKDEDTNAGQKKQWKADLVKAQRAWIAFRDANCGAVTADEFHSRNGMGPAMAACQLDMTVLRTDELMKRYTDN
jgi:uncharacterized protein YecT (DUF1311 family)